MASTKLPPNFDAWAQPFKLTNPDGSPLVLTMKHINAYRMNTARLAINYGTQIGASVLLLLVLLLLTRAEKRTSSIFITNALCLICNSIRCLLLSLYLTSSLYHPYTQFSGNFSKVNPHDLDTSNAASTFQFLTLIFVMISLSLQTWVACVTTKPLQRYIIMGVTTLLACAAIGTNMAFRILNMITIRRGEYMVKYKYLISAATITQATAIWVYSCVFTWKLGYAIIQRRRLGMPQFGPMQIIFIMGCQTMLIPAIFSVLQFRTDVMELGAQVLTIVCIFLPLSAIWAGVVNDKIPASRGANSTRHLFHSEFYRSTSSSTAGSSNASKIGTEKDRTLSVCTCSTKGKGNEGMGTTYPSRKHESDFFEDDGIHVGREFSVTREKGDDHV